MKNFQKSLALVFGLVFATVSVSYAYTPLTSQLDPGARGYNVTNLQTFFSDNSSIYPEGLVTGYFGGMTKNAVQRFQANYGFSQVGRVGPQTLNKINALINSGGWNGVTQNIADTAAPTFYSVSKTITSNSATFNWNANENITGKVFYSTSPVIIDEGDVNSVGFGVISGLTAGNSNIVSTNQQVYIGGLQSNTTYLLYVSFY